ncbi:hypothetical protein ES332_D07G227300v1 [Gossypium tomentosum]|uniref:Cytochrome P450 n=1 Tax=Gossypium tomentosum TaxID=34277 RepID=A0A5D2K9U8_GOSTO|nr:hypothetical protein ES332_D07G227300v1 [Gossypium tomentosum]
MDTMGKLLIIFTFSLCLCFLVALLYVFYKYWWIPYRIQLIMNSQGIRGMETTKKLRVMPHVYSWINKYGKSYLSWNGVRPQLVITDPEIVKENMIPAVVVSVETMLEKWKGREGKEMEVFQEFTLLTSEVISRTAFSSSYLEGEKIFDLLTKLSLIASRNVFKTRLPIISRFWKSSDEIELDKLAKMIYDSVMKIVKKREEIVTGEVDSFGNDFLGLLVNSYHDLDENKKLSIQDLVDESKTFYFAGQETTNFLLAWTILLLAVHTDWQEKARREVIEIIGKGNPNSEGIAKLKTITMIINETLRFYPPATGTIRKVEREVRLGKLVLPIDLEVNIRIHDPDLWGDDVHLIKPERFAEGISKATNYNAAAFFPLDWDHDLVLE